MTRKNLLKQWMWLPLAALLCACAEDLAEVSPAAQVEPEVAAKIIFNSKNAVAGTMLVRFDEPATVAIEKIVGAQTRAGFVATRSGVEEFDCVLERIGVVSLEPLFTIDPRHEERMRAAGLHRWYIVGFDEQTNLDEAACQMARVAEVECVEFNQQLKHICSSTVTPLDESAPVTRAAYDFNDPHLAKQWHYINTGNTSIYTGIKAGADVNCAEAWPLTTGDPRVVVAVIDEPVEFDHPDLVANMWVNPKTTDNGYTGDTHGYNFVSNKPLSEGGDHGTHVAGTIAAVNNNGVGVCGIAGGSGNGDGVRIMSCQIYDGNKGGTTAVSSKAITYAANNGACILQCSWGYDAGTITSDDTYKNRDSAEKTAIDYFISVQNCPAVGGGVVIFAAGNDGKAMSGYPSGYKDYVSVTSMSCDYTPAYYTNYGPGCNIAAPGGDFLQSYLYNSRGDGSQVLSTLPNGKYGYMQGTSMACPHVSGVAALGISYALKKGKNFSQKEFVSMLLTSANNINGYMTGTRESVTDAGTLTTMNLSDYKGKMGTGYIDAYRLLMQIDGITCLPVAVGSQVQLDFSPYVGDGNLNLKVSKVEIAPEDMARLGIAGEPTIFSNRALLTCTNPGSAIIKVTMTAGTGNNSGMNGMPVTKEFALIARSFGSINGGWF